jgi:anthranilate synthase component 2
VEAGLLLPLIREYASSKCILGVCLGHQAIGEAFGGKLVNLDTVYHGVATPVRIVNRESAGVNRQSTIGNRESAADDRQMEDTQGNFNYDNDIVGAESGQLSKKTPASNQLSETNEDYSRLTIHDSRRALFRGLPEKFEAGRYHSWIISDDGFPEDLEVTARDDNNFIMAIQHKNFDIQGVQFHPESVLTPMGEKIMRNWLEN